MQGPESGTLASSLPGGRASASSKLTESREGVGPFAGSSRALLSPYNADEVKGPTPLKRT